MLATVPGFCYAEADQIVSAGVTPDDTSFSVLWGLNNTGQSSGTLDAWWPSGRPHATSSKSVQVDAVHRPFGHSPSEP